MPRVTRNIRLSFTSGEVDPLLAGRSDLEKYYTGLETEENFISTLHGPLQRRPGTRFVAEVKDSSKEVRLKKFQFSTTQTYILEFGDLYMRVYRNGGQVQSGGSPFELVTPYTEADLGGMQFAQDADTLYIAHSNYAPRKVVRLADDDWTISVVPFLPPPSDEGTLLPDAVLTLAFQTGFDINFTADAASWQASDVGREITGDDGGRAVIITFNTAQSVQVDIVEDFPSTPYASGDWTIHGSPNTTLTPSAKGPRFSIITLTLTAAGWRTGVDEDKLVKVNKGVVKITEITSPTVARGQVMLGLTIADAAEGGEWSLNDEVWTSTKGWPQTITMYEGRMLFGATNTFPNRLWGSVSGHLEDFSEGTEDDDAFSFEIASSLLDAIEWISPAKRLFIGTVGGESVVNDGQNDPISPSNIIVRGEANNGSIRHQPIRVKDSIIHINRHQNKIWELGFNLERDSFIATNMLLLAQHLMGDCPGTIVEIAYQSESIPIIWLVRSDGQLIGITFHREENVIAGHRHVIGGVFDTDDAIVENIEVIPHWTDAYDTLWMVVRRTIDGGTKRYIEHFDNDLNTDSALTGSSLVTPFTTVSGLEHLEGQTVRVLEDFIVATNKVVSGGAITLDGEPFNVEVGLNYDSTMVTLPLQQPGAPTFTGLIKRIIKPILKLLDIGTVTVNGTTLSLGDGQTPFSGDVTVTNLGYDDQGQITLVIDNPYPGTITEIAAEASIDEDRR